MLFAASGLEGCAVKASDGDIGSVSDFLFDNRTWAVRWLAVDTGRWLPGRKVVDPPVRHRSARTAAKAHAADDDRRRQRSSSASI